VRRLIQAEVGEYEQRYTSFVAASAEAALAEVRRIEPESDWTLIDRMRENPPGTSELRKFTPYREWYIVPDGKERSDRRYDLSEIDFVE
jgi:hypothetical protein